MSARANGVSELETQRTAALAEMSFLRRLYWALRRELWESRSIYLAPLAVAALIVVGFAIGAVQLPERVRAAALLGTEKMHEAIVQPFLFAALLLMGVTFVVGIFYSLDALQGERRDRSILFWKSLPVSDLETVLAKAAIPLVILPLLTVVVTIVTHAIMLLVSRAVLPTSGGPMGTLTLFAFASVPKTWLALLWHMVAVHSLWYAPIFGWLLLISAWAPRVPWLWASLPLIAIAIVERIAFDSAVLANLLANRLGGGVRGDNFMPDSLKMTPLMHFEPAKFFTNPELWVGLAVAAAFLAAAVRLRRRRGPV